MFTHESCGSKKPTNEPFYKEAVRRGLELMEHIASSEKQIALWQMELGKLADEVGERCSERTVASLARRIGINPSTLNTYRHAYRKWKGIYPAPDKFSVVQELAAHPDKAEIVKKRPDLTAREAREEMRAYRAKQNGDDDAIRFAHDLLLICNKVMLVGLPEQWDLDGDLPPGLERAVEEAALHLAKIAHGLRAHAQAPADPPVRALALPAGLLPPPSGEGPHSVAG